MLLWVCTRAACSIFDGLYSRQERHDASRQRPDNLHTATEDDELHELGATLLQAALGCSAEELEWLLQQRASWMQLTVAAAAKLPECSSPSSMASLTAAIHSCVSQECDGTGLTHKTCQAMQRALLQLPVDDDSTEGCSELYGQLLEIAALALFGRHFGLDVTATTIAALLQEVCSQVRKQPHAQRWLALQALDAIWWAMQEAQQDTELSTGDSEVQWVAEVIADVDAGSLARSLSTGRSSGSPGSRGSSSREGSNEESTWELEQPEWVVEDDMDAPPATSPQPSTARGEAEQPQSLVLDAVKSHPLDLSDEVAATAPTSGLGRWKWLTSKPAVMAAACVAGPVLAAGAFMFMRRR